MRRPVSSGRTRVAATKSFPTLVRGWIANQALSSPQPGGAALFENFFPTATSARMRAGTQLHATVGDGSKQVGSMFSYVAGTSSRIFAATENAVYNITTIVDPLISPAAAVSGMTGGDWSVVQFQTPGGIFLRMVNGMDTPRVYDGTLFSTSPAITGTGLTPENLSFVWAYKKRLFFIEKNSMNAWYLDVESLGGTATKLPLGANFASGGFLTFGATWSLDSGGGLSEQCAFMSTEGEVVVFEGDNPGSASTWNRVGTYRIGRPLGPKAVIRGGGDLIISTDVGFVPLSQAVNRDAAVLAASAVSFPIETEWNDRVAQRSSVQWHAEVWPTRQMVVIALPSINDARPEMLVVNARTGSWGVYTGWDGTCLQLFDKRLFYGDGFGRIIEAEVGGLDVGEPEQPSRPYTAAAVPLFDGLRDPTAIKTAGTARAVIRAPGDVIVQMSAHADFMIEMPAAPSSSPGEDGSLWDIGLWGTATWGSQAVKETTQDWESVSAVGYALAPGIQITSGSIAPPDVELVRIDMTYDGGDL